MMVSCSESNHRICPGKGSLRKKLKRKSSVMKMYYLINSKGICTGKNSTLARSLGILRISRTQEGRNWLISKRMKAKLVLKFGNQLPTASLSNYNLDWTSLLLFWRVKVDWSQVPILNFWNVSWRVKIQATSMLVTDGEMCWWQF